ncbi:hypothetical protein P4O66_009698, partial [Electrophorus voltai]
SYEQTEDFFTMEKMQNKRTKTIQHSTNKGIREALSACTDQRKAKKVKGEGETEGKTALQSTGMQTRETTGYSPETPDTGQDMEKEVVPPPPHPAGPPPSNRQTGESGVRRSSSPHLWDRRPSWLDVRWA